MGYGSTVLDTDYLIVGAGAAGMAFTDALLTHSQATVTIVDRRDAPGGHWRDAYPYVRLHQPSTFYGVSSVPLGNDSVDLSGSNAGYYELAGADELRAYYEQVMVRHFLPSGRVRYFPCSNYAGTEHIESLLGNAPVPVRVARKVVDTTYLEGSVPATHAPPFAVADGVRCIPAGELVNVDDSPERFVIIGAGKTALDACVWLLERGVSPARIRWVKPREAWWFNRKHQQPHHLFPDMYLGAALQLEAMAEATSVDDLMARLESAGVCMRVDTRIEPTMFRGAIVSEAELALLRRIEDVVRLGHVRAIEPDEIILEEGRVPTNGRTVHVHCASSGLARRALRPIFAPTKITLQPIFWGFACCQFATLGVVEASVEADDEKNRLCPPIHYWDSDLDYLSAFLTGLAGDRLRGAHPVIGAWAKSTRLNPMSGAAAHRDDPRVTAIRDRIKQAAPVAAAKLAAFVDPRGA